MQITTTLERTRHDVFQWRRELSIPKKLALAIGIACLTGLLAQLRILTPWSPVPITGQTFAVLLAGVLLGRWWGGASMAIYGGLGLAGVPWFTGWAAGQVITGGYVVGFVLAALFLGYVTDKYVAARKFPVMLGIMLFASLVLVYVPGVIWLKFWLDVLNGGSTSFVAALGLGVAPFIAGDVIKAVLAALVARAILPVKLDKK